MKYNYIMGIIKLKNTLIFSCACFVYIIILSYKYNQNKNTFECMKLRNHLIENSILMSTKCVLY